MANNLSTEIRAFLEKPSTQDFLFAANKFIDLLECEIISNESFLKKIHSSLIELYATGYKLEEIDLTISHDYDRDITLNDKNIDKIIELGAQAFYKEVFDPANDSDVVQGWLVDDISDIYKDIKIEVEKIKINTDETVEDALWQLKFSFNNHWGNHCINAMRYLHYLWYEEK